MKKCPQCTRVYADDTLNYCLDDGTVLISHETSSTQENIPRQTEQDTEIIPNELVSSSLPPKQNSIDQTNEKINEKETVVASSNMRENSSNQNLRQGVSPIFAYLTIGLLGLLILLSCIGLFVWIDSGGTQNSNLNNQIAQNPTNSEDNETLSNIVLNVENETDTNSSNTNFTNTDTKPPNAKPTSEQKPTATAKPTATTEKTATPKPTEKATTTPTSEKPSGKYFVIMGSFPPKQADQANQRLAKARSAGLNARIINTSKFSKLKKGLLSVVAGPYSKDEAQNALSKALSVSGDAYIKAGF